MSIVFEKVKRVLIDELGVNENQINIDTKLIDDLGADSLDIVEIVMSLEENFEIDIPDDEAEQFNSVRDIVEYMTKVSKNAN